MKKLKPHFWYTKSQRNGVFLLLLLIVILQGAFVFIAKNPVNTTPLNTSDINTFQKRIDSLKQIKIASRKPKIYPFNPNYITDFKGQQLGLSIKQIDRLLAFRKTNQFINSAKQFQKVTGVSDSLLAVLSPLFKFPEWVIKNQSKKHLQKKASKIVFSTSDLNQATEADFKLIRGIGNVLSKRIIAYRKRLQGFTYSNQLYEVWHLDSLVVKKILANFSIKKLPTIKKININTATFKQVLATPYVDYKLCKKIFDYRDQVAELQSIKELKNIDGFPVDKYDRIILYLEAQ